MTLRGRPLALSALALTLSTALFKLAYFVMKMRLGALGGAEALGAATGSLAFVGLLFSLSHLGLPDRAMVQAAHAKGEVEGERTIQKDTAKTFIFNRQKILFSFRCSNLLFRLQNEVSI